MASLSAQIGANTSGAETSLGNVLGMLRRLRQESQQFGRGIRVFAPGELQDAIKGLRDASTAAGGFHRANLEGLNASHQAFGQTIRGNLDAYLRNLRRREGPAVGASAQEYFRQGGDPFRPDFSRIFANYNPAARQRQEELYYQNLYRGTGYAAPDRGAARSGAAAGGGGAGGTEASPTAAMVQALPIGRLLGGMGALAGITGIVSMVHKGVTGALDRETLRDQFLRQTRDTGASLESLTQRIEESAVAIGQSSLEAIGTAQAYAKASYQIDQAAIETGYRTGSGLARSYGMDIGQATGQIGTLARYGVGDGTEGDQRKFALMIGQAIRDTGMDANPEELLADLVQAVRTQAGATAAVPSEAYVENFLRYRMATAANPVLKGQEGMSMLGNLTNAMAGSEGDLMKMIFYDRALIAAGVEDIYQRKMARESGPLADLGQFGGQQGLSAMEAIYAQAKLEQPDVYKRSALMSAMGGMSMPQALEWIRVMERMEQDKGQGKGPGGLADRLRSDYGIEPETMRADAINETIKALATDGEALKALAGRYVEHADRLAATGNTGAGEAAQAVRTAIESGDEEAIRKALIPVIATYGAEDTTAQTQRELSAAFDQSLMALGDRLIEPLQLTMAMTDGGLSLLNNGLDKANNTLQQILDAIDPTGELRRTGKDVLKADMPGKPEDNAINWGYKPEGWKGKPTPTFEEVVSDLVKMFKGQGGSDDTTPLIDTAEILQQTARELSGADHAPMLMRAFQWLVDALKDTDQESDKGGESAPAAGTDSETPTLLRRLLDWVINPAGAGELPPLSDAIPTLFDWRTKTPQADLTSRWVDQARDRGGWGAPTARTGGEASTEVPGATYRFQKEIQEAAQQHGVPADVLAGIIAQESDFDPKAIGDQGRSWGLGQLNEKGAAAQYGLTKDQVLQMSPGEQIGYAARYLKEQITAAGGDTWEGVRRYNGGGDPQYVEKVQRRMQRFPRQQTGGEEPMEGLRFPLDDRVASYRDGARQFGAPRDGGGRSHAGADLLAAHGTPVKAMADGVVERIIPKFYKGTGAVVVRHKTLQGDRTAVYGEIAPGDVQVGDPVRQGQPLGTVKRHEDGSMLHLEWRHKGKAIDPTPLLDAAPTPQERQARRTAPTEAATQPITATKPPKPALVDTGSKVAEVAKVAEETKPSERKDEEAPTVKPEPVKPDTGAKAAETVPMVDPVKPDQTRQDTTKPEPTQPDTGVKPEPTQPDTGVKPEPTQPDTGVKPEPTQPDTGVKPEPKSAVQAPPVPEDYLPRRSVPKVAAATDGLKRRPLRAAVHPAKDLPSFGYAPADWGERYVQDAQPRDFSDLPSRYTARADQTRFGELTLNINQRVNNELRGRVQRRLQGAPGTSLPRLYGDVDLVA